MDKELKYQLANLHDVFLNASLQQDRMWKEPLLDSDMFTFMNSDRGRFERTWLTCLYVLVECWRSSHMRVVRDFISTQVPDCKIEQLLQEGKQEGLLKKLQDVRHYMCHECINKPGMQVYLK